MMGVFQTSLLLCLLSGSLRLNEAAGKGWGVNYGQLVTATEGAEVELPCTFRFPSGQGHVVRVRWMRDGTAATADNIVYSYTPTQVAVSYRGRTSLSGDLSSGSCALKIKNVAVSDATTYYFKFELKTDAYTGTPGVQLRVKCGAGSTAAALVSYGHSVAVREGDRVLLPCAFCFSWSRSDHRVQGFWLINDAYDETKTENIVYSSVSNTRPIEGYRGRVALVGSLSSGSCSLEIRDVRMGDSRTYFFRANIDGTKSSGGAGITVTVFNRSFTPKTEGSKRLIKKVGTRATLNCRTTSSQQAVTFKWWKYRSDGQYERLSESSRHLTLEAVAVKDVGWYECDAWSSTTNSEDSWTELQVFSFLRAQSELRATVPATLGCSVDAMVPMDSVTVRWVLDDVVKWTNSTSRSQSPDGTFTVTSLLSFTPSAEDDGKRYRCEASGGDLASTMVQEFILDVKYAPVVVNLSQDETCGGDLCILCEVKANPPATITWRTVGSDASEWNQTQRGDGTLTRSSVVMNRSQEHIVTCVAANEAGETEAVFDIQGGAGSGCWCVLSLLAPLVAWTAVGLCLLLLWRGVGEGGAGAHDKARPVHGTDTEGIRMEVTTPATDLRSSPD